MELKVNLMYFLTATGLLNTLFLSVFLFNRKSRNSVSNKLLSVILVLFAIKIGYASLEQQLWPWAFFYIFYTKLAVSAYLCIGPMFIYYINSLTNKDYKPKIKELLLLVPALCFALFLFNESAYITQNWFYILQTFFISFLLVTGYKLVQLWRQYKAGSSAINKKLIQWLFIIQFGILLVWTTAFGKFIYELAAFYSLAIYLLFIVVLGDFKTINMGWQSRIVELEAKTDLIIRLKALMETEKIFLDSSLTLPKLATHLSVSLHSLSREINTFYNQNFTEYINSYRIVEACKMLASDLYDNLTIECIAYDCGFNSLSSFNSAFKKQVNSTPSQFRMAKKKSFSISYN